MVRIRLRRIGSKGQPSYRLVITDQRNPRDGSFIEIIGSHNPRTQPATDLVNEERAFHWLSVGAQPSDAARRVLDRAGTLARFERLRKGEALETLVAEAAAQREANLPNYRTRYPSPAAGEGTMKPKQN